MRKWVYSAITSVVVVLIASMFMVSAQGQGDPALSEDDARRIAEEETGGEATQVDYEREDGEEVYEVQVRTSSGDKEVEIDANTGEVLEVEDADDDRWELFDWD